MPIYLCRICLKNTKEGFSLCEQYKEHNLSVVFEDLTGIKILPTVDNLPSKVCSKCLDKLYSAYDVRKLCIESDAYLRNRVKTETNQLECDEYENEDNLEHIDDNINWNADELNENLSLMEFDLDERKIFSVGEESENKKDNVNDKHIHHENSDLTTSKELKTLRSHPCTICNKTFQCEATLNKHIYLHNKVSNCPLCPKTFSSTSNLKRHIATHNDKLELNCDKCDRMFTETTDLFEHLKIHRFDKAEKSDEHLLSCELCNDYVTASYATFYKHMKTKHNIEHKVKAFKCRICEMRFASKQGMYRHIDNIHDNNRQNLRNCDKNFLCDECGKSFVTNFHLQTHVRSHTGVKPFSCKHCSKTFSQSSGLKIHTFIHMNIKPFACQVCHKRFTQHGHMREHLRTHTDKRPYTCSICNHSFRVKGNLKAHLLIHLGRKPHVCKHCGNRFNQSTHLRQHIIKKHKNS